MDSHTQVGVIPLYGTGLSSRKGGGESIPQSCESRGVEFLAGNFEWWRKRGRGKSYDSERKGGCTASLRRSISVWWGGGGKIWLVTAKEKGNEWYIKTKGPRSSEESRISLKVTTIVIVKSTRT